MQFERVGFHIFFAIFIPGIYLVAIIILSYACTLELLHLSTHEKIIAFLNDNKVISLSLILPTTYLLGVASNLVGPDVISRLSSKILCPRSRYCFWCKGDPPCGVFPYRTSLEQRMRERGIGDIAILMKELNPKYGEKENLSFVNYCKLFVEANNEVLAKQIRSAEVMVRFLAAASLAMLISTTIGVVFAILFVVSAQDSPLTILYFGFCLTNLLILSVTIGKFTHVRQREVLLTWYGVHLMLSGAAKNEGKVDFEELRKRIRFFCASSDMRVAVTAN